jgi:30S ribosomal protein S31
MGKGDKKTKRGKIISGTYGVRRLKKRRGTMTKMTDKSEVAGKKIEKSVETVKNKPVKKKTIEEKSPEINEKEQVAVPTAEEKKVKSSGKKAAEKPNKENQGE